MGIFFATLLNVLTVSDPFFPNTLSQKKENKNKTARNQEERREKKTRLISALAQWSPFDCHISFEGKRKREEKSHKRRKKGMKREREREKEKKKRKDTFIFPRFVTKTCSYYN